jgi:hypothetical protein
MASTTTAGLNVARLSATRIGQYRYGAVFEDLVGFWDINGSARFDSFHNNGVLEKRRGESYGAAYHRGFRQIQHDNPKSAALQAPRDSRSQISGTSNHHQILGHALEGQARSAAL